MALKRPECVRQMIPQLLALHTVAPAGSAIARDGVARASAELRRGNGSISRMAAGRGSALAQKIGLSANASVDFSPPLPMRKAIVSASGSASAAA